MLKQVTITKVFKSDKNKDGIAYVYKKGANVGKNFSRISIKTEQTGDEFYSSNAMAGDRAYTMNAGETIVLDLTEDNGFKNFRFPSKKEVDVFNQFNNQ